MPTGKLKSRDYFWLPVIITLTPAVVNWICLWLLDDAWLAIMLSALVFYSGAFWMTAVFRMSSHLVLPRDRALNSLVTGLLSAVAVLVLIGLLGVLFFTRVMTADMLSACSGKLVSSGVMKRGFLQFIVMVGVVLPAGEEMYWRGGLLGLLAQRHRGMKLQLLSASRFTLYHLVTVSYLMPSPAAIPLVAGVFIGGWLFSWMTLRTGNIGAATICHSMGAWGAIGCLI